jgi:hypothetical protein
VREADAEPVEDRGRLEQGDESSGFSRAQSVDDEGLEIEWTRRRGEHLTEDSDAGLSCAAVCDIEVFDVILRGQGAEDDSQFFPKKPPGRPQNFELFERGKIGR